VARTWIDASGEFIVTTLIPLISTVRPQASWSAACSTSPQPGDDRPNEPRRPSARLPRTRSESSLIGASGQPACRRRRVAAESPPSRRRRTMVANDSARRTRRITKPGISATPSKHLSIRCRQGFRHADRPALLSADSALGRLPCLQTLVAKTQQQSSRPLASRQAAADADSPQRTARTHPTRPKPRGRRSGYSGAARVTADASDVLVGLLGRDVLAELRGPSRARG
jgi:hypothetical protein